MLSFGSREEARRFTVVFDRILGTKSSWSDVNAAVDGYTVKGSRDPAMGTVADINIPISPINSSDKPASPECQISPGYHYGGHESIHSTCSLSAGDFMHSF